MNKLIHIASRDDIPLQYRDTPIGLLLEYHNLNRELDSYTKAEILIGMCMDHRKHLRIPTRFAYVLRSGGGNLRNYEFKISFAIAVGGASAIALIGHTDCGMVNLRTRKDQFVQGLAQKAGWEERKAEEHFIQFAGKFELENAVDFTFNEAKRLGLLYPGIQVVPLLYRVEDHLLYVIKA